LQLLRDAGERRRGHHDHEKQDCSFANESFNGGENLRSHYSGGTGEVRRIIGRKERQTGDGKSRRPEDGGDGDEDGDTIEIIRHRKNEKSKEKKSKGGGVPLAAYRSKRPLFRCPRGVDGQHLRGEASVSFGVFG